jgi:hypothetical protein
MKQQFHIKNMLALWTALESSYKRFMQILLKFKKVVLNCPKFNLTSMNSINKSVIHFTLHQ